MDDPESSIISILHSPTIPHVVVAFGLTATTTTLTLWGLVVLGMSQPLLRHHLSISQQTMFCNMTSLTINITPAIKLTVSLYVARLLTPVTHSCWSPWGFDRQCCCLFREASNMLLQLLNFSGLNSCCLL